MINVKCNSNQGAHTAPQASERDRFIAINYRFIITATLRYCRKFLVQPQDQDDAVQSVLLKLLEVWASYDPARGPAEPWLETVIHNTVHDFRRGTRSDIELIDDLPDNRRLENQPLDGIELDRLAARLSPRDREVFCLKTEGVPNAEIAARTGISVDNIWQILSRIRRKSEKKSA